MTSTSLRMKKQGYGESISIISISKELLWLRRMLRTNIIRIMWMAKVEDLRQLRGMVQRLIQINLGQVSRLLENKGMQAKGMGMKEIMAMVEELRILIANCSIKEAIQIQVVRQQARKKVQRLLLQKPVLRLLLQQTRPQVPQLQQATRKCQLWTDLNKYKTFSSKPGLVSIQNTLAGQAHAKSATKRDIS